MAKTVNWKPCTEADYWYGLECLPPALMKRGAFLVGEPYNFRTCGVSGKGAETFTAFAAALDGGKEVYFKADQPLTKLEFLEQVDALAYAVVA